MLGLRPNPLLCKLAGLRLAGGVSEYSIGNHKLEYCDTERDLRVVMSIDLKVESYCNQACLKANKMLGLIKRTFVVKTPEVMSNLYKMLVVLAYRRSSCAHSLSSILLRACASFTACVRVCSVPQGSMTPLYKNTCISLMIVEILE